MKIEKLVVGPIGTNTYIISSEEKNAILIDPGAEADKLIEFAEKNKLNLKYILITHAHFDHVMALEEIKSEYKETVVGFSKEDLDFLEYLSVGVDLSVEYYNPEEVKDALRFLSKEKENNILYLKENDLVEIDGIKIKTIETPGHTKGGLSFLVNEKHLFSGDTLFRRNIGGTDFYGGDLEQMKKSLKKLLKLENHVVVYPGHGEETTIRDSKLWLHAQGLIK